MKHAITYHTVPRETFKNTKHLIAQHKSAIDLYIDQLKWWNRRINLMSRDVSRETIYNHVYHSVLLSQFLSFKSANLVIDAGTGGGLPGIPLAITNTEKDFLLNDIITKKILAVKQIARKISLNNINFYDGNIGDLPFSGSFLLISKHAFKINRLYYLTKEQPWSSIFFYKGLNFIGELDSISIPLKINVHKLFKYSTGSFFKNKVIIEIERQKPLFA